MITTNKMERITPQSNLIHPDFPDLVNNFVYYHQQVNVADNKVWNNTPPSYSHYKSIEDVKDDIIRNPENYIGNGSITVRCPVSYFYTSDTKVRPKDDDVRKVTETPDRLHDYHEIKVKTAQWMIQHDGFDPRSDILHGTARWVYSDRGQPIGFVIVKDRGNARTHMGIASVGGQDVELLITLDFDPVDPNRSIEDIRATESETFFSDAKERRGFDSKTAFSSGYLSGREEFVKKANFLDQYLKVDFADVINTERRKEGKEPHKYTLSSLSKLDFGVNGNPGGYITKFGAENLVAATNLMKDVLDERKGNTEIYTSTIHTLLKTFYYLTSTPKELGHKKKTSCGAITTKENLYTALRYIFTSQTRNDNWRFDMKNLSKSDSEKDTSWIAFKVYMSELLKDLREDNNRSNDYRSEHPCLAAYISDIGTRYNRIEAMKIVNS